MKSFLPRLYKFFSRVRKAFSLRLFSVLLLLLISTVTALAIDSSYKAFLPSGWKPGFSSLAIYLAALLFLIPLANRFAFLPEHWAVRRYISKLSAEEKALLKRFIAEERMIDMPLEFPSDTVSRLLELGIVSAGSGILYPKSALNPKPYAYFSMPNWIFQHLKGTPGLLEI